jgi:hypothetical protein
LRRTELLAYGWPKNSRAMQKHLKQLSPALLATKHTYRFRDEYAARCGDPFAVKTREGPIDVQYWEKVGGEKEGVWVLAPPS